MTSADSQTNEASPEEGQGGGIASTFGQSVEEGTERLRRHTVGLLATGTVGGIDVGVGVFGLFIVQKETGNSLLAALAFSIGFIALTLANSELFTENFLVPIAAVLAGEERWTSVIRLWAGTVVMNLVGGWLIMFIVMNGFPDLQETARGLDDRYTSLGISATSLASAVMGGTLMTLLTWMERATKSVPAKLFAAISMGFLLAAGSVHHSIVLSLEMFAAIMAGTTHGYLQWLPIFGWTVLGNVIGGLGFVTTLRFLQVGRERIKEHR